MARAALRSPRGRLFSAFAVLSLAWLGFRLLGAGPVGPRLASDVYSTGYDIWAGGVAALGVFWLARSSREPIWLPLAAGLVALTLGDLLYDLASHGVIDVPQASPSVMDLFYLPAYLAMAVTSARLVGQYHGGGLGPALDALVVSLGVAAAGFPLITQPYLDRLDGGSLLGNGLRVLYPTCDLLLLAASVVAALAGGQLWPVRMLGTACALCTIADPTYLLQNSNGSYTNGGWMDWCYLAQYTLMAATVSCDLPSPAEHRSDRVSAGLRRRLALLCVSALTCPALFLVVNLAARDSTKGFRENFYAAATLVVVALVCLRLLLLVGENARTVGQLSDALAEREQLSHDLQHQARHDLVTGLPNRYHLNDQAADLLAARSERGGSRHAVVFLDLDDFKSINDTFGHSAGDQLLRTVAERLRAVCRPSDLVARLGGDEFAVLLPGSSADEAAAIAGRMLEVLAEPLSVAGQRIQVGASAGVTEMVHGTGRYADALSEADVAMYAAKRAGKNRVRVYAEAMRDEVLGDAGLAADLARAVREREIGVAYQPVVELVTRRGVALEALARWHPAGRGAVPPSLFLPIAVDRGLIVDLDLMVLDRTLTEAAPWMPAHPALRVAFNASAQLLSRSDCADRVLAALEAHRLPGSVLTLEITEQALVEQSGDVAVQLEALRAAGIAIALDDFGTGYSSLAYLQDMPIDILKLDRSFVVRGVSGSQASPLLRSVVLLGRELKMKVLAEGIETAEQHAALLSTGCHSGQGWLYAPALAARDVPSRLGVPLPLPVVERVAVGAYSGGSS